MSSGDSPLADLSAAPELRRSVEVEYWVIDDEGRLTDPGTLVDAAPGVEHEFVVPLLEIKTSPCSTTDQLREQLVSRLERVRRRAETQGKRLVPLATPVAEGSIQDRPDERTRIQDRVVGEAFEYVRHCAGTHIHVEQEPGREIDQLNTLIALDPALALVNSSPYFGQSYLAAGARSKLYRWMAYEGLSHQGQLWPYAEDRTEWARRYERGYASFLTQAVIAGCDSETVASCFDPETAVWTPIKLRSGFSTVEWRSPDTALPSQIIRLADDIASIVACLEQVPVQIGDEGRITDEAMVVPSFGRLQKYVDASIRQGLDSDAVCSYLTRMGFDVEAYRPLTHELDRRGDLTEAGARELRLDYADRLADDLDELTSDRTPSSSPHV